MNAVSDASAPLAQLIDMGGPVMWVLLALAVAGVVTFFYLMLFGALYAPRLTGPLRRLLARWQSNPDAAQPEQIRAQAGFFGRRNPMLHLLVDSMAGCQTGANTTAVRETAVRDAQSSLEPFEGPLKLIEVIAALAPLLGLLGTVMGMMDAFSAMAATEGRANASQLSGGIYEALTTTAAGLVVAIPFAALAAWIEFRLRRIHRTMNSALVSVFSVVPNQAADAAPATDATAPRREPARTSSDTYPSSDHQRLAHAAG
ncbi:MAG: MotA/TolQ/ExbB proton channel family protein [Pseudomonadota bacterium]|nr:MotA/TolQ/ExbB proton channel family protein [Pseudomonadota bacterium]